MCEGEENTSLFLSGQRLEVSGTSPQQCFLFGLFRSSFSRRIRAFRTRTARTLEANVSSRRGRTRRQNLRSFGRRGTRIAAVSYRAAAPGGSWSEPLRDEVR